MHAIITVAAVTSVFVTQFSCNKTLYDDLA